MYVSGRPPCPSRGGKVYSGRLKFGELEFRVLGSDDFGGSRVKGLV